jgi:sugar/nucleoside kinase (ribokinase family)
LPLLSHPRATLYVNLAEAGTLCQTRFVDAASAAEGLLARGAARVLVTDGARPCADGQSGSRVLTDCPPPVPVARVTGAGDSFMAAHLVAELRGADRQAALGAALRAAADHISRETPE